MASLPDTNYAHWTASEVIAQFGDLPIAHICTNPAPGEATEADVVRWHDRHDRLFELVDGTLVEKAMGWQESYLAGVIIRILGNFIDKHKLGMVFSTDGMLRLAPGQIRIPDVAYISHQRYAGRTLKRSAFWELGCDLAVEVISPSNTPREMQRKLADYFAAGVSLVWLVYLDPREVVAYTSPTESTALRGDDSLTGGELLPGFSVRVAELFAGLDEQPA